MFPPALEVTADNLFNGNVILSLRLWGSTSAAAVRASRMLRAHFKKYRPIVSPFLSAAVTTSLAKLEEGYPAGSDTAWYLLPPPSGGMAVIQVGYLRGQRAPIIEPPGETNFNTLGLAIRRSVLGLRHPVARLPHGADVSRRVIIPIRS